MEKSESSQEVQQDLDSGKLEETAKAIDSEVKHPLNMQLIEACVNQNYTKATQLLEEGAHPNARHVCRSGHVTEFGDTPLHYACRYGSLEFVKILIEKFNADPHSSAEILIRRLDGFKKGFGEVHPKALLYTYIELQYTPIHEACIHNNTSIVCYLISKQICDSNMTDLHNNTLLHVACYSGSTDVVKYLLTLKNNAINSTNNDGQTPLHLACRQQYSEIVEFLVQTSDLDPLIPDRNGNTALHLACKYQNLHIVEILITKTEYEIDLINDDNETPIDLVCNNGKYKYLSLDQHQGPFEESYEYRRKDRRRYSTKLYRYSLKVHARTCPSKAHWLHIVKFLVKTVKDTKPSLFNGALHLACSDGDVDSVKFLIKNTNCSLKSLNYYYNDGDTVVHSAVKSNSIDTAIFLTTIRHCDPNIHNMMGESVLHIACADGDLKLAKKLITVLKCRPENLNAAGNNSLHVASLNGHHEIVQFLLENSICKSNLPNTNGNTALHLACMRSSSLQTLCILIEKGNGNPRLTNKDGNTPLHIACKNRNLDKVEFLAIQQKFDPNIVNNDGKTLFHTACVCGNTEMAMFLATQSDFNPNLFNNGNTALHIACEYGNLELVKFLSTQQLFGCILNVTNKDGKAPFHVVCANGNMEIAKFLAEQPDFDPNLVYDGNTPLHIACKSGNLELVTILATQSNCNCNLPSNEGNTALHIACGSENLNIDIIEFLATQPDLNPNLVNKNGDTPLHIACKNIKMHLSAVKFLAKLGCNPNITNKDGNTPLHIACELNQQEIVQELITQQECDANIVNRGGNCPLHIVCQAGHLDIVKILIQLYHKSSDTKQRGKAGTMCENRDKTDKQVFNTVDNPKNDINLPNNDGNTPLHLACLHPNPDINIVVTLLNIARCNPNSVNKHGNTPLHLACDRVQVDIVKYLLYQGKCNPNIADDNGNTPLHIACDRNSEPLVNHLIINSHSRCNPHLQNNKGNTPLHIACQHEFIPNVKILLNVAKCDPNVKNNSGIPPSKMASNPLIIRELIRHGANTADIYKAFGKEKRMKQPIQPPIKVCIVGNPSAGKSTLTAALQKETSLLQRTLISKKVSKVDEKTAGIIPHDFQSKICGHVTLFDFAGQCEFYDSHAALLQNSIQTSPPIFLLVVDISKSEHDIKHEVLYWLSFLRSQCTSVDKKPHIIVVGSHIDILIAQGEDPKNKKKVIDPLLTNNYFCFNGFVTMDCQYYQSKGMTELRQCIKKSCDELRITKTISFNLHLFFVYLIDNFKDSVAIQLHQIQPEVPQDFISTFLPSSQEQLHKLCKELNDRGHILYLQDSTNEENSWIILDKMTLLSDVTGTIFAPKDFKEHCQLSSSTGVVPLSKISSQFPNYESRMLIGFLSHMEFCKEIHDQEIINMIEKSSTQIPANEISEDRSALRNNRHFFFPGLICLSCPSDVWEQHCEYNFHFGWILQCSKMEDFYTTQFLHILLLRLAFSFAFPHKAQPSSSDADHPAIQRRCSIWKNGIYWGNRDGIETLVELLDHNKSVTVLMRSEQTNLACLKLRSKVICTVLEAAETFCSNVVSTESFIDPYEVFKHPIIPTSQLDLFSLSEVVESVLCRKPSTLSYRGKPMSLSNLLSFEPYANLNGIALQDFFDEQMSRNKLDDHFIMKFASKQKEIVLEHFQEPSKVSSDDAESVLYSWRDGCKGTYQCLRDKLDEISIFGGRNPFELAGISVQLTDQFNSTQDEKVLNDQGKLSQNDFHIVKSEIWDARVQWYNIGVQLNITVSSLDIIQEENRGNVNRCFTEMLKQWLKTKPQWSDLVEALRSPAVNEHVLAETIQTHHVIIESIHIQ